jgi:hypothetical protein
LFLADRSRQASLSASGLMVLFWARRTRRKNKIANAPNATRPSAPSAMYRGQSLTKIDSEAEPPREPSTIRKSASQRRAYQRCQCEHAGQSRKIDRDALQGDCGHDDDRSAGIDACGAHSGYYAPHDEDVGGWRGCAKDGSRFECGHCSHKGLFDR